MLTTALALLGFSVVAAILLMRTRVRAATSEARLRADIGDLQVQADRFRALLFAEPQILISWAAGDNRPQISGDISLLMPQESQQYQPQRILAFGTWLPPEPALQMDHAVDALREAGEGFLLNLTTSNGRAIEAMGRAIGGQAIVRIRELGGVAPGTRRNRTSATRRCWRKPSCCATSPPRRRGRSGPRARKGSLRYANAAYARATEAASVADAIHRNLELLESDQRDEMNRALNDNSAFTARLPIVVGGERRIYDVHALNARRRQRRHRHRRQRSQRACARRWCGWRRRIAAPSINCRRASPCSTASGGWRSTTIPIAGCGTSTAPFSTAIPTIPACSTGCAPRAKLPEQPDFRAWKAKLHEAYRAVEPAKDTWYLPDGRARQRRHHAESGRRRHLSVRRRHRKPRPGAALRRPDPGPARNARQSRRSGRGVRQQRPRAIVQSGLRQDVEAVARSAARAAAYRDRRSLVQAAVRRRRDLADASARPSPRSRTGSRCR